MELRALAPIVVASAPAQVVAAATLVSNGEHIVGVTDAELLRPFHGQRLAILDGDRAIAITKWGMGRYTGVGIIEIGELGAATELVPLPISAVCASINTHNAPAAIVTLAKSSAGHERHLIAVHVDPDDATGMSDRPTYVATPIDPAHAAIAIAGCPVFAWFPPDHVLGRPSEVVLVALAYPYRGSARPRATAAIAELVGLDDCGRALISEPDPAERPELAPAAGEIEQKTDLKSD